MKALQFEKNLPKFAAARLSSTVLSSSGVRVAPLQLVNREPLPLPAPEGIRVKSLLSGICGSDLASISGHASRYFESMVSFPFIPGHEVVGIAEDGRRVVLEPALSCRVRGISPLCEACLRDDSGSCQYLRGGHLLPGLQTGYCASTGGGWGQEFVAHPSQLHNVPEYFSDEAAVIVEPTACAIHAVLSADLMTDNDVVVIGSGTLGLLTVAALKELVNPRTIMATAKYPQQKEFAYELGATEVIDPNEVTRAVRRLRGAKLIGNYVTDGVDAVFDCVGTSSSITQSFEVVKPRGTVSLIGMPDNVSLNLTSLWHREVRLCGSYAYGREANGERTFDIAMRLVEQAKLERLVSAHYSIANYRDAIDHAANAGSRGAIKVVFDLRERQ
jgi:threonine dehydrogenase-like Zn-dependent dehydrogenase